MRDTVFVRRRFVALTAPRAATDRDKCWPRCDDLCTKPDRANGVLYRSVAKWLGRAWQPTALIDGAALAAGAD